MAEAVAPGAAHRFGSTDRRDAWWAGPLATALGLGAFVAYSTARAIQNAYYYYPYENVAAEHHALLSPFYSPLLLFDWLPVWFSPAFLILWAPAGFRFTCYYYRKAYYRAFFWDPPACAVGEGRGPRYRGERGLFVFQNLHRYFLYLAVIFVFILTWDVLRALSWPAPGGGRAFHVSLGTLVLAVNVVLLGGYTFGCHSLRHLVGGKLDCFSCARGKGARVGTRFQLWKKVSRLNERHPLFAWCSLFWVGFSDFYVWMAASGVWTDPRII